MADAAVAAGGEGGQAEGGLPGQIADGSVPDVSAPDSSAQQVKAKPIPPRGGDGRFVARPGESQAHAEVRAMFHEGNRGKHGDQVADILGTSASLEGEAEASETSEAETGQEPELEAGAEEGAEPEKRDLDPEGKGKEALIEVTIEGKTHQYTLDQLKSRVTSDAGRVSELNRQIRSFEAQTKAQLDWHERNARDWQAAYQNLERKLQAGGGRQQPQEQDPDSGDVIAQAVKGITWDAIASSENPMEALQQAFYQFGRNLMQIQEREAAPLIEQQQRAEEVRSKSMQFIQIAQRMRDQFPFMGDEQTLVNEVLPLVEQLYPDGSFSPTPQGMWQIALAYKELKRQQNPGPPALLPLPPRAFEDPGDTNGVVGLTDQSGTPLPKAGAPKTAEDYVRSIFHPEKGRGTRSEAERLLLG